MGIVGDGEVRDFTALGDVVNVAARLLELVEGGQVMMTSAVAEAAAVSGGIEVSLRVKGNSQPMSARTVSVS